MTRDMGAFMTGDDAIFLRHGDPAIAGPSGGVCGGGGGGGGR